MRYYILNINLNKKSEVDKWIGERGEAPIFFGLITLQQIKEKIKVDEELKKSAGYPIGPRGYVDAKKFVETFKEINEENVVFSIGDEFVYIFKQEGPLQEKKEEEYKGELIKFFRIDLIKKVKIKNCPLVLTSIKANRYIQSGTFRDLNDEKYLGNTNALEYLIHDKIIEIPDYVRYLQCLSSLELETLVAKYLEEKGLFVPAYKGGFLKNFDLFCRNLGTSDIVLGEKIIKPGTSLSVQIKLNLKKDHKKDLERVDLFFCINSELQDKKVYDWRFLEKEIVQSGATKKWLEAVLNWAKIKK